MARPRKTETGEQQMAGSLDEFLAQIQEAKLAEGFVVVAASHPDAEDHMHQGKYSGFQVTKGEKFARWSDGSST